MKLQQHLCCHQHPARHMHNWLSPHPQSKPGKGEAEPSTYHLPFMMLRLATIYVIHDSIWTLAEPSSTTSVGLVRLNLMDHTNKHVHASTTERAKVLP